MALGAKKETSIQINVDTSELSPAQVRMIKSLNTMLLHTITTDEEGEFFEGSAELMRIMASLIKQANFSTLLKSNEIPYAEQALEYSMDALADQITGAKITNYDN